MTYSGMEEKDKEYNRLDHATILFDYSTILMRENNEFSWRVKNWEF